MLKEACETYIFTAFMIYAIHYSALHVLGTLLSQQTFPHTHYV